MRTAWIAFALILAPLIALADDGATQITLYAGFDAEPDWSPDGSQIAFHRRAEGYDDEIWIIPAAGGSATQLTTYPAHPRSGVGHPRWSPDGSEIAYHVWIIPYYGPAQSRIDVVPATGGTPTTIPIIGHSYATAPCWSPDGGMIAFASYLEELPGFPAQNICVVTAAGGNAMQVTTRGGSNPAWSPDGSLIAFEQGGDIWVIPASGGLVVPLSCDGGDPAWAPDGSQIAFAKETDGNWDIWTRPATWGGPPPPLTRITTDPAVDTEPSWSPDGSEIAFTSDRSGNEDIWVIAAPGPVAIDQKSWGSIKGKYRQ